VAGKLTRAFMGVQIQCAQCHDHPFDKWTQEEFYGMASFFTEVRVRREQKDGKGQGYHVEEAQRGPVGRKMEGPNLSIPDSKSGPIKPSFIETAKGVEPGTSRRASFAKYVTSPENLQFAKMCVNRYWSHFFGTGIVNPVDDFNGKNKPSHPGADRRAGEGLHRPQVRPALADQGDHGLRGLQRDLADGREGARPQSEKLFALGRDPRAGARADPAVGDRGGDLDEGPMMGRREMRGAGLKGGGKGAKSEQTQRMIMALTAQFRNTFEDDEGSEAVEFAGTIPSALLMMNSQIVAGGSTDRRFNGFADMLSEASVAGVEGAGDLLSCLSRTPTSSESSRWMAHVQKAQGNAGYEDLMWTLLQHERIPLQPLESGIETDSHEAAGREARRLFY
jgi:hypothetical protein